MTQATSSVYSERPSKIPILSKRQLKFADPAGEDKKIQEQVMNGGAHELPAQLNKSMGEKKSVKPPKPKKEPQRVRTGRRTVLTLSAFIFVLGAILVWFVLRTSSAEATLLKDSVGGETLKLHNGSSFEIEPSGMERGFLVREDKGIQAIDKPERFQADSDFDVKVGEETFNSGTSVSEGDVVAAFDQLCVGIVCANSTYSGQWMFDVFCCSAIEDGICCHRYSRLFYVVLVCSLALIVWAAGLLSSMCYFFEVNGGRFTPQPPIELVVVAGGAGVDLENGAEHTEE